MRINYWSNSELANKIRGTKKPLALELGEWDDWDNKAKAAHPIRYWIAENFLDGIQTVICSPQDTLHSLVYWINRRFIDQSHIIKTGLKKGSWHEVEEKILYGMFEELVSFVEVQLANQSWHRESEEHNREKNDHFVPWYAKGSILRNLIPWRSQHYGVQYLLWSASLTQGSSYYLEPENPAYNLPSNQAVAAMEQLELYVWWKFIRPMRLDPMDDSGYTDYFEEMREKHGDGLFHWGKETNEEKVRQQACAKLCHITEKSYEKEDEEMMIRLIKIRRSLWS